MKAVESPIPPVRAAQQALQQHLWLHVGAFQG
uniref:Uncharacterized protein n=1 Tax=Arundo donax TaxID=35708 RepID=A0A0A9E7S7_ARUDO